RPGSVRPPHMLSVSHLAHLPHTRGPSGGEVSVPQSTHPGLRALDQGPKIAANTGPNTLTSRRGRQEPLLGISWRRATKLRPTKRRVRQEPHFRPNWPGLAAVARGLAEIRPPGRSRADWLRTKFADIHERRRR